ncbi:MAG: isoleucine--tRNA ligase, partial [Nitrospirae bacterium]|nr:isoleucine--tRNA ligase [Nitrospirota bacterium]
SIYVKFALKEDAIAKVLPSLSGKMVSILIWTTTPWTLPANLALAVHPDITYVAAEINGEVAIIAEERIEPLRETLSLKGVLHRFKGAVLEGGKAKHPFIERDSKIILGDFVSLAEGTGIVHIAPGHGEDDYEAGLKYGLDIYAPVDDKGCFTEEIKDFAGQNVFKANQEIIDLLKSKDALLASEKITHSYPHCWRCKKPVIFRATEQWFISMEKNDLRKKALSEIDKVNWIPRWGRERIYGMVENRPDWCISRQRAWGVPITVFRCKSCKNFLMDREAIERIVSEVEKAGADIWFIKSATELLPEGYRCKSCGGSDFIKEQDIMDVWFDSGVSHAAVVEADKRLSWPSNLYLEGSDQHRGWFQSSLLCSTGTRDMSPYKAVLTHGFVVDGQGKKMSKSLGNVISPQEVISKHGAEILRLWASAADYREDMRISKEILERLVEAYRKIRNTCRFLLGNIYDFDYTSSIDRKSLLEIDRLAMSKLQRLIQRVNRAYENFEFHEVFHSIYNFCVIDMSSFYLDILKDRLYTFKANSQERRASQWVIYKVLVALTKMMAPILSFTAEEIWGFIKEKEESVFLSEFPEVEQEFLDEKLEKKWEGLLKIRDEVNKALELKRQEKFIGNSLEAKITLFLSDAKYNLLKEYTTFLPALFIVSSIEIFKDGKAPHDAYVSSEIDGLAIAIEKAPGHKCERCWNWSLDVGKYEDYPELCGRCYKVLKG